MCIGCHSFHFHLVRKRFDSSLEIKLFPYFFLANLIPSSLPCNQLMVSSKEVSLKVEAMADAQCAYFLLDYILYKNISTQNHWNLRVNYNFRAMQGLSPVYNLMYCG